MVLEYKVSVSESHKGTLYSTTSNLCVILHILIYTKLKKTLLISLFFKEGTPEPQSLSSVMSQLTC